tara:strand:- start:10665 stop:11060 length:396 start_codon:yes stop_codon:yes gene_type:complete
MKSLKNNFISYIQNQKFGIYYLPARYQYVILRDYYKKYNQIFTLPQGEPIFTNKNIKLRSLINKLNSDKELVLLSIYILPSNLKLRNEILKILIKKKIKTHFIFENIFANNKKQYSYVSDIIKLDEFLNKN